jgi:CubicO group peptidase (beta-lactamase class C family)
MNLNRRSFLRRVGGAAAGLGAASWTSGCAGLARPATAAGLPRSTPEAEGLPSAAILAFLDAAHEGGHELHSLMIVRHGRVVAEGWWTPYGPRLNHTLYSLSKSFTSTAVGFAVAEGRLSVDDKVLPFFPEARPAVVNEHLAALRVRDLLCMASGHEKDPTHPIVKEEDWVRAFLASPFTCPPGSRFVYNSEATYMCSAIVQRLTGQRILDYLRPRLFDPLGIEDMTWEVCPRGTNTGGWGLSVPTEALAKFGEFLRRRGEWQGRRLLPAAWVDEATTFKIQQPVPAGGERKDWHQGYGYQFWRCRHNAFRGDGAFGQFMVVMPEQEAVVAITSECRNLQGELDLVWDHILPALKPRPRTADPRAHDRLQERLAGLALPLPAGVAAPSVAADIAGRTFRIEPGGSGIESAGFDIGSGGGRLTLSEGGRDHAIDFGFGRWRTGETALPGTPPRLISGGAPKPGTRSKVAAAAAWKDGRTLELVLRYIETPHRDTITCRFEDGAARISFMNSIAAMGPKPKDSRPDLVGRS